MAIFSSKPAKSLAAKTQAKTVAGTSVAGTSVAGTVTGVKTMKLSLVSGIGLWRSIAVLLATLMLAACGGSSNVIDQAPPDTAFAAEQYEIGVGDSLSIAVWKNEDLSVEALVRPDGMISLPLIGDIRAVEQTTEELATAITEKLNTYVRTPQVAVIVDNPASADFQSRVRVTGAVSSPTTMPYRNGMTVMDLVLAAGGLTEFASGNRAALHRKNSDGEVIAYSVRLRDIFSKGDLRTNYSLRPSDVVTVPERAF